MDFHFWSWKSHGKVIENTFWKRVVTLQMDWHWYHGARAGFSYGMSRCLAPMPTRTWKLHLARQALQPSWRHLTSMLDSHHRVNSSRLRWSPTAQSTGMLFSSWASWAVGDWWRRPAMFEHLRFYCNGFPLWCNDLIRFCCMMVLLMMTGQSIGCTTKQIFVIYFCNFWATRGFPLLKNEKYW